MRDLHSNLKLVQAVKAQVVGDTDVQSAAIDLKGFNSAEILIDVGTAGDTLGATVKFDVIVTHSDDDSSYSAVAAGDILGNDAPGSNGEILTIDADAEAALVYQFGYVGGKRYLKIEVESDGTHSTGTPFAVSVLKGNAALASVN